MNTLFQTVSPSIAVLCSLFDVDTFVEMLHVSKSTHTTLSLIIKKYKQIARKHGFTLYHNVFLAQKEITMPDLIITTPQRIKNKILAVDDLPIHNLTLSEIPSQKSEIF
jgi:hypothetical protein